MNNNFGNPFRNPLSGIDTSRNGVNQIMNPSIRTYPAEIRKETVQDASGSTGVEGAAETVPGKSAAVAGGAVQNWSIGVALRPNAATAAGNAAVGSSAAAGQNAAGGNIPDVATENSGFQLQFTGNNIMNGFILSELLGRPKYLQKRRW